MRIYSKHIIRKLTYSTLTISFLLTGIVWLLQVLKQVHLLENGIRITSFFYLTILTVPSLLLVIAPVALFCSTIYVYNRLKSDREIIIFENSGLNYWQIARPALIFASWIMIIAYIISFYLLPLSYGQFKSMLRHFKDNYASALIQEQVFTPISRNITLYVEAKSPDDSLQNIILFDSRDPKNHTIMLANSGKIILREGKLYFNLTNGHRQSIDNNGNLETLFFDNLTVDLSNKDNALTNSRRDLKEQFLPELFWPDDENDLAKINELRAEGHRRIVWPFFNLVVSILALAIFIPGEYQRNGNLKKILMATGAVITATTLHFICVNLSIKNTAFSYMMYVNSITILGLATLSFKTRSKL